MPERAFRDFFMCYNWFQNKAQACPYDPAEQRFICKGEKFMTNGMKMRAADFFRPEDKDYMIAMRRELHEYPEIGFDLPRTNALVERELQKMGIPYSKEFGKASFVAELGNSIEGPVVGIRADMDALPMEEKTDLPFASKIPGRMHSCGHDAHTAILLGTAKMLKRAEEEGKLSCAVRLIFQANEEGEDSGAKAMVADGVMDGIDEIIALHQDVGVPAGSIGVFKGPFMAACEAYRIDFYGKAAHATAPEKGRDALAMAVKAYQDIYLMKCREIGPFEDHILSISSLTAGTAHNIIADHATMLISFRFFSMETHDKVDRRIREICEHAAAELGGTVTIQGEIGAPVVVNDPAITDRVRAAAETVVGPENVIEVKKRMGSEDFSHFLLKKPGKLLRLGNGNPEKGCTEASHSSYFMLDEDVLEIGAKVFVQYVLDR